MKRQIILLGGGYSIKEGIDKGLWTKIKDKFVIGTNYSYTHFKNSTIQCFVDNDFYNKNIKDLTELDLIIGNKKPLKQKLNNTILLPSVAKYYRDIQHGIYKSSLVGLFSLSLAIYLSQPGDEIFILGHDYGEYRNSNYEKIATNRNDLKNWTVKDKKNRALTHYYQEENKIKHRGIAKISYYNQRGRAEKDYSCYKDIKDIKIYNVSLVSKIPESIFPKISYDEFFKKLDNKCYSQDELRKEIKNKLKWVKND